MKSKALMILGTGSSVGKSWLAAGFCRLFSDWGYKVAPFKAQNMSNNSFVTDEGGEMGRAQVVQAECARLKPSIHMNPILLKPAADNHSQVIVHGKSIGHFKARDYYALKPQIEKAVRESYEKLAAENEIIVLEGAGSPVEMNLKPNDVVNMAAAKMADAQCLLAGDIDRGGIFASLLGTLDLLTAEERARICGLVINKFRGDRSLFEEGVRILEQKSGKKIWGVIPYDRSFWLDEEDGVSLEQNVSAAAAPNTLDIAVLRLPRISNFTDFEVFRHEPGVTLRYVQHTAEFGNPDLLIMPGTKATIADLLYLMENGFCEVIHKYAARGGRILGICGGYQMLGEWIEDETGAESEKQRIKGLGFLKAVTKFQPEKILKQVSESFETQIFGSAVRGNLEAYEIHMGQTELKQSYRSFGKEGAVHPDGKIAGTYYHGFFDSPSLRASFLNALAKSTGKPESFQAGFSVQEIKDMHYNKLRQHLEANLNLDLVTETLGLTADFRKSK